MTDKLYTPFQRNTFYYNSQNTPFSRGDSYDGNNLVHNMKNPDQVFLYQNPLHYGSSMEDLSSSQEQPFDESEDFLYPTTPSSRQGSGESGYKSTSTNTPRTPSRHGPSSAFPNRSSSGYQGQRNLSSGGISGEFESDDLFLSSQHHGTYGLPPQQQQYVFIYFFYISIIFNFQFSKTQRHTIYIFL
jgi:hypothetical protein